MSIFEDVGGRPTLVRAHKLFYDKVYADPWLSQYFKGVKQAFIEEQQTDFMTGILGGPAIFRGRVPQQAHIHIEITAELFDLRHALLEASLVECGIPVALREKWLRTDQAFRARLLRDRANCQKRWPTDTVLAFDRPAKRAVA